jgi:catecholate siderophore receptor
VRASADVNQRLGDTVAARVDAVFHRNDVPGRDVESYERWGVAPAVTLGLMGPTQVTLAYVHQQDDNVPLYGVPYFKSLVNDGPLAEVDPSDYFGYRNLDRQDITVDRLTLTIAHPFSDSVRLRNLTRWQKVDQHSQTSAPQGTFCLSTTGRQPVGGHALASAGIACPATLPAGFFAPSGPRGLVRDQSNEQFVNQTDVRVVTETASFTNTLVVGGSLAWEDYAITTAQLLRNPDGSAFTAVPEHPAGQSGHGLRGPPQPDRHRPVGQRHAQHGGVRVRHARIRPPRAQRRRALGEQRGDLPQPAVGDLSPGDHPADLRRSSRRSTATRSCSPTASAPWPSRPRT